MTTENIDRGPLVTFALFAYNQERYIREAIEGAFSQTYEPLEIILSDDCSTDRTFEIMQEMAAGYRGPHQVRVRRNEVNVGTALHFSLAANAGKGRLFVVAAGDDISMPERTDKLVACWTEAGSRCGVFHSDMIAFADGESLTSGKRRSPQRILDKNEMRRRLLCGGPLYIFAPTTMYSRELIDGFPPLLGGSIVEDGPMLYRGILVGDFFHVADPLVLVRRTDKNSGTGLTVRNADHWNRLFRSRIISAFTTIRDVQSLRSVDPELAWKLEARLIRHIQRLSRFILPETGLITPTRRIYIALNLLLGNAYRRNVRGNIALALSTLSLR